MTGADRYDRDRVTWTGYSLIGVWAFFLYFMGPASNAIRQDLSLSDSSAGLVGTVLAVGLALSAIASPAAVRRWGRTPSLLRVLVALSLCAALMAFGGRYPLILLAVCGIGLAGAVMANVATAVLADRHAGHKARAITEANAAASWLAIVAPALVGVFLSLPTGWRGAALVMAAVPLVMLLPVRRLPEPTSKLPSAGAAASKEALPRAFWFSLVTVSMAVAVEFSVNFWAAALIDERTGSGLSAAATALSAMALGMALGRTFAAGLSARFPLPRLIVGFFLVTALGIAALLLAPTYWLSVAALLLTGLGVSVLFPFAQSNALGLAIGGLDRAIAMTALAAGVALGSAPVILGLIAGPAGLQVAFALGFLLVAAGIASVAATAVIRARPH